MSTDLVVFQENSGLELAPEFMPLIADGVASDLSDGVGGGFAVISFKASKFRIKHKGNETPITDAKGDPVGSIEVVIVRANKHITKQYFGKAFEDGDTNPPICFSTDGVVPSATSPQPQAAKCALCPKNAFGSAPPRDGKASKGKACQDNRKLAVVPVGDIENETFGGPMLFRVPPSSLQDLAAFGQQWAARGYPYNAIAVRIGMDIDAAYPKPTFKAIRPLTSEEATKILELVHSAAVERVLVDFDPGAQAPAVAPATEEFEQPPVAPTPPPAPKPVVKPAPAPTAAKPVVPKQTLMPATPPAAAAPAASKATFGGKPVAATATKPAALPMAKPKKAAPAAAPAAEEVAEDGETADPGQVDTDIEAILAGLNAPAA